MSRGNENSQIILNFVARVALFQQAIAERLGLNLTELKCLGLLARQGPLTGSQLASTLGLTAGAITNAVDHLERAGFVQRERDTHDRRRWTVVPSAERIREVEQLYAPLGRGVTSLFARYNEQERARILEFLVQASQILEEGTQQLKGADPPTQSSDTF